MVIFFWNIELPKAREKNLTLFLHVFDIDSNQWLPPFKLDSDEGDKLLLRRRTVHPMDSATNPEDIEFDAKRNEKLWMKKYIGEPPSFSPLILWKAPSILTLGKLRKMVRKMIENYRQEKHKSEF